MSKIDLIRVRNSEALKLPAIRRILTEAFSTHSFVEDVEGALDELEYWVIRPHAGLFLVRENGSWVSMGFAQLGESMFAPHMIVVHVFNKGSRAALRALNDGLVAFGRAGGYDKALTLDFNKRDRAFRKLFQEGGPATPIGQAYYFRFDGEQNGQ